MVKELRNKDDVMKKRPGCNLWKSQDNMVNELVNTIVLCKRRRGRTSCVKITKRLNNCVTTTAG